MLRGNKQFSIQLVTLARQSGGSFKTVADRSRIAARLAEQMLKLNIQIRDVNHIKIHHIEHYVRNRLAEDISKRTLQNEMAALRTILAAAGKTKLADSKHEKLSNDALNLSGASRAVSKTAITDERFHEALALVRSKEEGVALAMEIARHLGLRTEEAVHSAKLLKTWQQALARGDERFRVVFGTKGGRPRSARALNVVNLKECIKKAIHFADNHKGNLVSSTGLKKAINYYRSVLRSSGLIGLNSPHSMRYAHSQDLLEVHLKQGLQHNEDTAMI